MRETRGVTVNNDTEKHGFISDGLITRRSSGLYSIISLLASLQDSIPTVSDLRGCLLKQRDA